MQYRSHEDVALSQTRVDRRAKKKEQKAELHSQILDKKSRYHGTLIEIRLKRYQIISVSRFNVHWYSASRRRIFRRPQQECDCIIVVHY